MNQDDITPSTPAPAGESLTIRVGMSVADAEQLLIEATLAKHGGDKEAAARDLGISIKTIYSRLQVYEAERKGRALAKGVAS